MAITKISGTCNQRSSTLWQGCINGIVGEGGSWLENIKKIPSEISKGEGCR